METDKEEFIYCYYCGCEILKEDAKKFAGLTWCGDCPPVLDDIDYLFEKADQAYDKSNDF